MSRIAVVLTLVALAPATCAGSVPAEDNPVLRKLVGDAIKKELASKDTRDKGWHHGNTVVWLPNPNRSIAVEITKLTIQDGRASLEGSISSLLAFEHRMRLPAGSHTCCGVGRANLSLRVSALLGSQISGAQVSIGRLQIRELHLSSEAARPFQGAVQEGTNLVLKMKKGDIERRLENALNGVRF
jgi:hypothetical protein